MKKKKTTVKEGYAVTKCKHRIQVPIDSSEQEFLAAWRNPIQTPEKTPSTTPVFLSCEQVTQVTAATKQKLAQELAAAKQVPDLNVQDDHFCTCPECKKKRKANQPTIPEHGKNFSIKKQSIVLCIDKDTKEQKVVSETSEYKNTPSKKAAGPAPLGMCGGLGGKKGLKARRSYPGGPLLDEGYTKNNLERIMHESNMSPFPEFPRSPGELPVNLKALNDLLSNDEYWKSMVQKESVADGEEEARKSMNKKKNVFRKKIKKYYRAQGKEDGFLNQHVAFRSRDGKVHLFVPAECYYKDMDPTVFGPDFADFEFACVFPQRDRMNTAMCRQLLGEDSVTTTPNHAYVTIEKGIPTIRFAFPAMHYPDEGSPTRHNKDEEDTDDDE
jgi:hypothetical protein